MNNNFYIGVVEDRHDPEAMGRVRVRVFGVHSDDRLNEVPIDSLPWSMVMQPANASTAAGSISQLVEGTWVLIMYIDTNMQDPLVIGSLPSMIGSQEPDYTKGFSDPFGVYPKWSDGTADTTLVGKPDTYTEHPVYTERARTKIPSIPKAKRYKVSTVQGDDADVAYERSEWAEPELRGGQESQYPYNNVHEYEGGMLEEFDSTPGNQRITRTHPSGTYDEVLVDGTKTVKIVGTGYEIVLKDKRMYIKGDLDLTVDGNMNHFVKGDYTLEVGGNFYQEVGVSKQTKVVGNDVSEIGQDMSVHIAADCHTKAGNNYNLSVGSNKVDFIRESYVRQIEGNYASTTRGKESRFIYGDYAQVNLANMIEVTKGNHTIETIGTVKIDTDTNFDIIAAQDMTGTISGGMTYAVDGNVDIDAARIDLN